MKVLVTTAFALTLLLSAFTVFFALQSGSLDGEPHASIALQPPAKTTAKVEPAPAVKPVVAAAVEEAAPAPEPQPVAVTEPAALETKIIETAKVEPDTVPEPAPAAEMQTVEIKTSDAEAKPAAEVAATKAPATEASANLIIPDETSFGLGVGNLGPIPEATPSTN